jgi:hypothetical protein
MEGSLEPDNLVFRIPNMFGIQIPTVLVPSTSVSPVEFLLLSFAVHNISFKHPVSSLFICPKQHHNTILPQTQNGHHNFVQVDAKGGGLKKIAILYCVTFCTAVKSMDFLSLGLFVGRRSVAISDVSSADLS